MDKKTLDRNKKVIKLLMKAKLDISIEEFFDMAHFIQWLDSEIKQAEMPKEKVEVVEKPSPTKKKVKRANS